MYSSWWKAAIGSVFLAVAGSLPVYGQGDQVKTWSGDNVWGHVESSTREQVTVSPQKPEDDTKNVQVNEIEWIQFFDEPTDMRSARIAASKGDYDQAIEDLSAVNPSDLDRELVKQELAYRKVYYAVRRLASGDDPTAAQKAGTALNGFLSEHQNNFHYYEATEALGDLLVSLGKYDQANKFYAKLADAPWPEYKLKTNLLHGRALQLEGKHAEAVVAFDAVIKSDAKGPLADRQRQEATIARTFSLADSGKAAEAVKILTDLIKQADDEDDAKLLARAYTALGNCYRKMNDSKQALWAYLHVDVKYNTVPEAHAEALANLIPLWTEAHRPDRAAEARDTLEKRYPFSRWNKQRPN